MLFVGGVVYQVVRFVAMTVTNPWHIAWCGKTDPAQRERYIKKATESSAKLIFHTLAFIWGWRAINDSYGLPWMLGGKYSMYDYFTDHWIIEQDWPLHGPPRPLITYGLYCAGYHFSEFMRHCLHESHRQDFVEMLLHHILTLALVGCYLISNGHMIGALIAVLHDAADIVICLARIVHSTKHDHWTIALFASMVGVWIWTRMMMLPYCVWLL